MYPEAELNTLHGGVLGAEAIRDYGEGKEEAERYSKEFIADLKRDPKFKSHDGEQRVLKLNDDMVKLYRAEPVYEGSDMPLYAPRFKPGIRDPAARQRPNYYESKFKPGIRDQAARETHEHEMQNFGVNEHLYSAAPYTPFVSTTPDFERAIHYAKERGAQHKKVPMRIYEITSPNAVDVSGFETNTENREFIIPGYVPKDQYKIVATYEYV